MLNKNSTREKILKSALNMFSEKGYDGVGVDLIAEKCGLKGPSIYKHFKGKEEILDVLISNLEDYYNEKFGFEQNNVKIPDSMDELIANAFEQINFTMNDESIKKTRKLLTLEQFRNKKIAKIASTHICEGISNLYCIIFQKMMDKKVINKTDARMLSIEFVYPVSILIQTCDREPERKDEILETIKNYFCHFASKYSVG